MKKDTESLVKLLKYYKKYKILCILVLILSLGYAGISLLSPIYEGKLLGFLKISIKLRLLKLQFYYVL